MGLNKRLIDQVGGAAGGIPTDYDALYKFENNLNDETGNYNMSVASGTFEYSTNSKFDTYGTNFNGSSEYATISMDFTSGGAFESYSASAWLKFNGIPTNSVHKLLSKGSISTGYVFSVRDDGTNRQIYGGGAYDDFSSNDFPAYDNTNYYHCVVTYDSSTNTVSTYVNGSFSRSYTADGTDLPNASQCVFGRSSYGSFHIPNVIVDQMYIFSRVLDIDEISALYNE